MKICLIALMALLKTGLCVAQVHEAWVARYNGPGNGLDYCAGIAIDTQGNVFVAGWTASTGVPTDYVTVKYNNAGVQQWVRTYNGPGNDADRVGGISVDHQGNVFVTGLSTGAGTLSDIATIKYDTAGVQQWVQRYNGPANHIDGANSISVDNAGNVIVAGSSYGGQSNNYDFITVKYSNAGSQEWVQRYNGPLFPGSYDAQYALAVAQDGSVLVTGESQDSIGAKICITIKYGPGGAQQWVKLYEGAFAAEGRAIAVDTAGNVFVAGRNQLIVGSDYFIIKYNAAGVQQWIRTYSGPGTGEERPWDIALDQQGNVFVTGESSGAGTGSDFATVKYNSAGTQQWVQRYNGPENAADIGFAIAVDNVGNVIVTGRVNAVSNSDYATLMYTNDGVQVWMRRYNGPSNGTDVAVAVAVDSAGVVYVSGASHGGSPINYDIATIAYRQGLVITSPRPGERWMGGDIDTILWNGGGANQFVDIEFSTDSGATYSQIDFAIPADSGKYVWLVPDSLTTRARIRLLDTATQETLAVSDTFRVKPYALTRINANGHYEQFLPTDHGWSFANADGNFWPNPWWSQFQYAGGIDRHTGLPFDPAFPAAPVFALPAHFVDWPAFVDVFGRDSCFWPLTNSYKVKAVERWMASKTTWNGSCFGITQSGLLYFHYRDQFLQRHPSVPSTGKLATIQVMTDSIRLINTRYFAMQFGRLKRTHDANNSGTTPRQALQLIRQMWANDSADDDAGLKYRDPAGSGGHAVIPYRLLRSTTNLNQFQLFVCNSNNPTSLVDFILIDSLANTWQEFTGFGWAQGTTNMFPYPPAVGFFAPTIFPVSFSSGVREGGGSIEIRSPHRSDLRILSPSGDSIGVLNGRAFNSMPGAQLLSLETGHPQPPLGYDVPAGNYRMQVTNPVDSNIVVTVSTDSLSISYSRTGGRTGERDELSYDGEFGVKNSDAVQKTVSMQLLVAGSSRDLAANITDVLVAVNDSVSASVDAQARPKFINFGPAKSYHLALRNSSAQGLRRFISGTVNVPAQSSHIISPNWDSLATAVVKIYIDLGNNGTIDDTIFVSNTVDVGDRGSLQIPTEYNLAQNYPNPFNPTTLIKFALPQNSQVKLVVYNQLGQEVTRLVDEERPAGRHEITWNAASVASGVYFYKMEAYGSNGARFVETRKMLLLK